MLSTKCSCSIFDLELVHHILEGYLSRKDNGDKYVQASADLLLVSAYLPNIYSYDIVINNFPFTLQPGTSSTFHIK